VGGVVVTVGRADTPGGAAGRGYRGRCDVTGGGVIPGRNQTDNWWVDGAT